jgi:hypothetical protein
VGSRSELVRIHGYRARTRDLVPSAAQWVIRPSRCCRAASRSCVCRGDAVEERQRRISGASRPTRQPSAWRVSIRGSVGSKGAHAWPVPSSSTSLPTIGHPSIECQPVPAGVLVVTTQHVGAALEGDVPKVVVTSALDSIALADGVLTVSEFRATTSPPELQRFHLDSVAGLQLALLRQMD